MSGINIYYPGPRGNSQFPDNNEDEAHDYTEGEVEPGDIYLKPDPLDADSLDGPYSGKGEGTIYIAERVNGKIVWKKIGKYTRAISRYNGKPVLLKYFDTRYVKVRDSGSESEIDVNNYFPPPWPNRVWIPVKKFIGRIHFEPYGGLENDGYTWPSGTEGPYPFDGSISNSDREKYRIQANAAVKNSIITDLQNDQTNANAFVGTSITTTDTNQEYKFNETTLSFVETAFKDLTVIADGNLKLQNNVGSTFGFTFNSSNVANVTVGGNTVISSNGYGNTTIRNALINISLDSTDATLSGQNQPVSLKVSGVLKSMQSIGSEGGELYLEKPATGTTLSSGITIDVHENRLRIFENSAPNRGGYFEITNLPGGVGALLNTFRESLPPSNKGAAGDIKGQYAVNGDDLYVCNTTFSDGTANIWTKITGVSNW